MVGSADVLFEVSWEVCNKVGGIYTVLMSKAKLVSQRYGDNYFAIGPYFHDKVIGEFEELVPPDEMKGVFEDLKNQGIICHFGRWLIKGEPKAILLDFTGFLGKGNDIKGQHWNDFQIDSLNVAYDYTEPVVWSTAAGMLIERMSSLFKGKRIVAQFHEWLAGAGLLYLKKNRVPVGTVFTTHATILGRSIAGSNVDLYGILEGIDSNKEAYNYGIASKHQMEKASCQKADVFTTVSQITAMEAEHLLGRKPDVILPNGLDFEAFPTFEEASVKHKHLKFRVKEFILYQFFPYQQFNLDETLIYFIFGRYEFQNKGIDVFIEALSRLNMQLIEEKSDRTIAAFFFIPAGIKGLKAELIENKRYYEDVKESVDDEMENLRPRIIYTLVSRKTLTKENLFEESFLTEIKKKMLKFSKDGRTPSLVTHDLFDENNDAIINHFRANNLFNKANDKVKVIFYPTYLTGADGLLDLAYYEAILGAHLGVFPSYYEPWGYTPLETAALGVASVTTDLAGFGRYICEECEQLEYPGIYVLKRYKKSREEIVDGLFQILYHYASLSKEKRVENKIEARRLASLADWKNLIGSYFKAHDMAAEKV